MSFGVNVDFNANVARFSQQVERISGDLDRFSQRSGRTSSIVGASFKALGGVIAGVSFASVIKENVDFGDKLQKLSIRLGASVESLSQLQHVAELSGVSFETMTLGLQRMTRRVAEAANGTGEAVKALDELSLSAGTLKKLAPEDQFEKIADKLSRVSDPADRVRLAMKLFDTEGVSLLQTMQGGADGIRKMREEADQLGLTLSQETADGMADTNDAIARLTASFTSLTREITADVAPAITSFITSLRGIEELDAKARIRDISTEISGLIKNLERHRQGGISGNLQGLFGFDPIEAEETLKRLKQEQKDLLDGWRAPLGTPVSFDTGSVVPELSSDSGGSQIKSTSRAMQEMTGPASEWNKLMEEAARITEQTRTPLENLITEIERYSDFADRGLINQETLNRALAQAGEEYDALTEKVKESSDQMDTYADQAARNMQDAFADYLFDPFDDGLDGMLSGFLSVIKRMVAEQASAQIFGSEGLNLGGLFSSAVGGVFGGIFGKEQAQAPQFSLPSPAQFQAVKPEKPAAPQSIKLASVSGQGASKISISTNVQVSGGNGGSENANQLGQLLNATIRQKLIEEKRPGGLLA